MDFITIKRTYGNPPNTDTASLGIDGKHEGLQVIGALPHRSYIEPYDAEAAKALLLWLLAWMAKHGATPEPIIVHVEGGLVQDVEGIPPGVTVEVWDYDVSDFATDDDMAEMETDDDDSEPFVRCVYKP